MMTVRAGIIGPASMLTRYGVRSHVNPAASFAISTSAPNFSAWA